MKSAEYTIKTMTPSEHSDASYGALFACEDKERRNYKLMYNNRAIEIELTFDEAKQAKEYYEQCDAEFLEANDYEELGGH